MPILRIAIGPDGPVVDLGLWIGRAAAQGPIARGRPVPAPQTVRALIDAGADRTAIHPAVVGSIASPPAGTARVRRPGGPGAFRSVALHDVWPAVAKSPSPAIPAARVEIEAVVVPRQSANAFAGRP